MELFIIILIIFAAFLFIRCNLDADSEINQEEFKQNYENKTKRYDWH